MTEREIKNVINSFIGLYKEDQNRWENERYSHYDFFKLLFDFFEPEEIRNRFKWEYPVGVPDYGTGNKGAAVDIVFTDDFGKWIAIEIELVGAGKGLEDELIKCVRKLKTAPICRKHMTKGYVIPLLKREAGKKARGYGGKTFSDICNGAVNNAKKEIGNFPIEVITDGILL